MIGKRSNTPGAMFIFMGAAFLLMSAVGIIPILLSDESIFEFGNIFSLIGSAAFGIAAIAFIVVGISILKLPLCLIEATPTSIIFTKKQIEIKFSDIDSIYRGLSKIGFKGRPPKFGPVIVRTSDGTKYKQDNIAEIEETVNILNKLHREYLIKTAQKNA